MGRVKDELLYQEEARAYAFDERARKNNMECSECGEIIDEEDESVYEDTGMCSLHAYLMNKDD